MMALASWPARHPALALLILVVLVLLGGVLAARLPFERYPSSSSATLGVQAELPGWDATQIEVSLTRLLEETLASLPRLDETVSRSRDGRATIELRFSSAAAREAAFEEARRRLAQVTARLPAGMATPVVERHDLPLRPAAVYAITADPLSAEVAKWAEQALARPLRELLEVAAVALEGVDGSEVLIQPDSRRLATLGLSFEDLIQALRRGDAAPRRRGARRDSVAMPASVEAIAARAVRLADGDSLALAEVAQISVISRPAVEHPRYYGTPALMLHVYPRFSAEAPAIAERVRAHLGWLRVNGMIQAGVEIHPVFDESHETRTWFKEILWLSGVCIVSTLLAVYLFFGGRACLATLCAFGVWLPAAAGLLWGVGLTFNALTVAGLMLGCVPLAAISVRSLAPASAAALATAALVLPWVAGATFRPYAQTAAVFFLATVLGGIVSWLMTPWLRASANTVAPLARLLPSSLRNWPRPLAAWAMTVLVLSVIAADVRVLPARTANEVGGTVILRVQDEDPQRLLAFANELLPQLYAMSDLEDIVFSSVAEERWRLQIDAQRVEELGLGVAEIGRSFAIAREGLVVGEIADADAQLLLRLRLAPGAAGESFERLLLRGEHKNQAAVYLRNVGVAERVIEARERLRVQRLPAVEIRARWHTALPPLKLTQLRETLSPPPGGALYWSTFATPLEVDSFAP